MKKLIASLAVAVGATAIVAGAAGTAAAETRFPVKTGLGSYTDCAYWIMSNGTAGSVYECQEGYEGWAVVWVAP